MALVLVAALEPRAVADDPGTADVGGCLRCRPCSLWPLTCGRAFTDPVALLAPEKVLVTVPAVTAGGSVGGVAQAVAATTVMRCRL
jgi:hypothetical protein